MTTKYHHMAQSVHGALANWKNSDWKDVCRDDDGNIMTPAQVKAEFERLKAEGVDLIPMGDCDNFDPKNGCLGHETPTKELLEIVTEVCERSHGEHDK